MLREQTESGLNGLVVLAENFLDESTKAEDRLMSVGTLMGAGRVS